MFPNRIHRLNRAVAALSLAWGTVIVHAQTPPAPSASTPAAAIPVVTVKAQATGSEFALDGVVQAVRQSTIAAQASGRIATLLVKAGDKVRTGQLLLTIDDRETAAGVQRSQAQVAQSEAELRNAKANLARTQDLKAKGFISQSALDTADAQYQSALAMRDQARAGAASSGLAQGFTKVVAPYDGWILETPAQVGDLAVPGKPLLTIYAPQPLRAVVQVPASRLPTVRAANQIAVDVASKTIAPSAKTTVPSADPVSQTTELRLDLPTKESADLIPGQQVRVRFMGAISNAAASNKLIVPAAAIVRRGELTAVYVKTKEANPATFALRAVRLGAAQGVAGFEVLAGLRDGETVALEPNRAGFAK